MISLPPWRLLRPPTAPMRMWDAGRGLVVLLGLAFALAAVPASALATPRYASPADEGTGDCRPTKAGRKILKRKGKLKVTLRVTFTPTGGTPNSKTRKITFKVKKKKKKK